MTLNPAVTATVHGERPKLAALRAETLTDLERHSLQLANLANLLGAEHEDWAGHYTGDLNRAKQHIDSAWRSLGYARDIIAGK